MSMFFKKINRYLTFTFDDGFIASARKIDKIIHPHKATFYLVTGWVKPNNLPINDNYNIGLDHGSIKDWQQLSAQGHDIGSHTHSHLDYKHDANISEEKLQQEYWQSLEFIKQIHPAPYSLAYPHNVGIAPDSNYNSVRIGQKKHIYNELDKLDWLALKSYNPDIHCQSSSAIYQKIAKVPDNSWLILNLHGLDSEGWHPWPSRDFQELCNYIVQQKFIIKSVAEMTNDFKN